MVQAGQGHGADIASQRADDLDLLAISRVQELTTAGLHVRTLDLGAGRGAQTVRLLSAGAMSSVAVDLEDFSLDFANLLPSEGREKASFIQMDLSTPDLAKKIQKLTTVKCYDVIVCQRTIHYFPWQSAAIFVAQIAQLLVPGGRLYISASGLGSELGMGYEKTGTAPEARFGPLAQGMASKHGILAPVCLYTRDDLIAQCSTAGLHVISAQESAFGNIKVAAEKR